MTIRGAWGTRTGWIRRALTNGRFWWGPADPKDGILVGGTPDDTLANSGRFFFDPNTGILAAGRGAQSTSATGSSIALGPATASGNNAIAIATGSGGARASATGSGALAIQTGNTNGTTSSGSGSVAIGQGATASGVGAFAIGNLAAASGIGAFSFGTEGDSNNTAAGDKSFVFGGSCQTNATFGFAHGRYGNANRYGQDTRGFSIFGNVGDAQLSQLGFRGSTTDATPTELTLFGQAGQYLTVGNNRTLSFTANVAAHRTDVTGTVAAWPSISGAITRDAGGSCRIVGAVTGAGTTAICDAGAATWNVTLTADAANNRLAITVTGEAAKTIRWVVSVEAVEVSG